MNILYLGYWNASDPLTIATIHPHLKILQDFSFIKRIVFVNIERESTQPAFSPAFEVTKIVFHPVFSLNLQLGLLNKVSDFLRFPKLISNIIKQYDIDAILARGSPAGALAYLVHRRSGIAFSVESFEPHADYMLESGVWKVHDPRYVFQKLWEKRQKKYARCLMPVTENFRDRLLMEGLSLDKVITVPCSVDQKIFRFNMNDRVLMRRKLGLANDEIVGIYVGRYGGLYMGEEVFKLYSEAFRFLQGFFLVILSPVEFHKWIKAQMVKYGLPVARTHVGFVANGEVPAYLSMSDFGYATYKHGKFKAYLSPVKVGEFFASGLPVVLTKGVGDESDIIEKKSAGVLFDPLDINRQSMQNMYVRLKRLIRNPDLKTILPNIAAHHRNSDKAKEAYKRLFEG